MRNRWGLIVMVTLLVLVVGRLAAAPGRRRRGLRQRRRAGPAAHLSGRRRAGRGARPQRPPVRLHRRGLPGDRRSVGGRRPGAHRPGAHHAARRPGSRAHGEAVGGQPLRRPRDPDLAGDRRRHRGARAARRPLRGRPGPAVPGRRRRRPGGRVRRPGRHRPGRHRADLRGRAVRDAGRAHRRGGQRRQPDPVGHRRVDAGGRRQHRAAHPRPGPPVRDGAAARRGVQRRRDDTGIGRRPRRADRRGGGDGLLPGLRPRLLLLDRSRPAGQPGGVRRLRARLGHEGRHRCRRRSRRASPPPTRC